jgi:hypothetical protein
MSGGFIRRAVHYPMPSLIFNWGSELVERKNRSNSVLHCCFVPICVDFRAVVLREGRLDGLVFRVTEFCWILFVPICVDFQITVLRDIMQQHTSVCLVCYKWTMIQISFLIP